MITDKALLVAIVILYTQVHFDKIIAIVTGR